MSEQSDRQERIEELERELPMRRSMVFPTLEMQQRSDAVLKDMEAELARLRNEGGGEEARCEICGWPYAESREKGWNKQRLAASPTPSAGPVAWRDQVRPEVAAFALLMERELRTNDYKGGWKDDQAWKLVPRVNEEAQELRDLVRDAKLGTIAAADLDQPFGCFATLREAVGSEAADVANMAMMVADVCGALPLYTAPPPQPDALREAFDQVKEALSDLLAVFPKGAVSGAREIVERAEMVVDHVDLPEHAALSTAPAQSDDRAELLNEDKPMKLTDEHVKYMVDRFLSWKLPERFAPDNGISYTRPNYHPAVDASPSGTNLFDATQAEAMVRHIIDGLTIKSDERAGLERAAKWHEEQARKTMIAHKILFHQNSAADLRKIATSATVTPLSVAGRSEPRYAASGGQDG
jgi:NTP pyrophosphatase (non-canonical NTP hydrolase)